MSAEEGAMRGGGWSGILFRFLLPYRLEEMIISMLFGE